MLTKYTCGHIGKETGKKMRRFIGVAEIRKEKVESVNKACPNCKPEHD